MIFFAVAAPTPGSVVRSFSLAVLKSTSAAGAAAPAPLPFAAGAADAGAAAGRQASRAIAAATPAPCGHDLLRDVLIAISFSMNWHSCQAVRCDRKIQGGEPIISAASAAETPGRPPARGRPPPHRFGQRLRWRIESRA